MLGKMRSIERRRPGVVPLFGLPGCRLRGAQGVPLEEALQLSVAALEELQHLPMRPSIHGDAAHAGRGDAVGAMAAAAADAEEGAKADGGPVRVGCAAVDAAPVAGQAR